MKTTFITVATFDRLAESYVFLGDSPPKESEAKGTPKKKETK